MTPSAIARLIEANPVARESEEQLQEHIAALLGADFVREYRFGPGSRVDLFDPASGTAIEVKVKGAGGAIMRQLVRYACEPAVRSIVVASTKPLSVPALIAGKPVVVSALWKWGAR